LLTQAVQLFNSRGTIASTQKAGRDIEADQAKANKLVLEALETVAKWVAKLPENQHPDPAPASLSPEVEPLPVEQPAKRGTKRRRAAVDAEDAEVRWAKASLPTIRFSELQNSFAMYFTFFLKQYSEHA
jgi:hypothetical protein